MQNRPPELRPVSQQGRRSYLTTDWFIVALPTKRTCILKKQQQQQLLLLLLLLQAEAADVSEGVLIGLYFI